MDSNNIYTQVQDHYGSLARADKPSYSGAIAQAFGYTEEELSSIPGDANLGLSCGNPLAIASLREGETVIDLGSGAGFDVFLAANKVGPTGRAIGVDMNKDMLARARANHARSGAAPNVSFVEGQITRVPLADGIADCVISNCVINLVPAGEKASVFAEMARLLGPGGRVAVSDVLARKPLPAGLRESVAAYVGCVAGCGARDDYVRFLAESGFRDIAIVDTRSDLNVYAEMAKEGNGDAVGCCGPSVSGAATSGTALEAPSCCEKKDVDCCSKSSSGGGDFESPGNTSTPGAAEASCCSGTTPKMRSDATTSWDLAAIDVNEWVGSYKIFAVKT